MNKCPICQKKIKKILYIKKHNYSVYQCQNCFLCFRYPFTVCDESFDSHTVNERRLSYYKLISEKIINSDIKSICDIGSASGKGLSFFIKNNYNVLAIDINPKAIEYLNKNNINAVCHNFEKSEYPIKNYKAVLLIDCIEHLTNPLIFFKNLKNSISADTELFIITPNFNSIYRIISNSNWVAFNPHHNLFFSKKSLSYILSIYDFKNIRFNTIDSPIFNEELFWRIGLRDKLLAGSSFNKNGKNKLKTLVKKINSYIKFINYYPETLCNSLMLGDSLYCSFRN